MKKTLQEQFKNRKIKKPNKLLAKIVIWAFSCISKKRGVSFVYENDYKELENKQVIYLCQHKSLDDFYYVFAGMKRTDVHVLCGMQNVFQKYFYTLLKHLGVIAKYLYQPDMLAIKQMRQVVDFGGSLAIFPEGIQSTSGSTHPINPTTFKYVFKQGLPVVLVSLKGSYFTRTRYSKDVKKGKITVTFSKLFGVEDFKNYSQEELYNRLIERFSYNEFLEFSGEKVEFIGKKPNIDGLDNIIYKCPECLAEGAFKIDSDQMYCTRCGFKVKMNNCYELLPISKNLPFKNTDEWYKWQRSVIKNEILSNDFLLNAKVKIATVNPYKITDNYSLLYIGEGVLTLTNKGLTYVGTRNGENVTLFFEPNSLYSLSMSLSYEFDFYYKNEYFNFKLLENEKLMAKWTIASEEIHNLYDEKWKKVSDEVYKC
ncbi:MAG: hypothetical protein IKL82_03225 [Clostridia bacterium]|nr:hypothetical protein [Clostridia bacterium]